MSDYEIPVHFKTVATSPPTATETLVAPRRPKIYAPLRHCDGCRRFTTDTMCWYCTRSTDPLNELTAQPLLNTCPAYFRLLQVDPGWWFVRDASTQEIIGHGRTAESAIGCARRAAAERLRDEHADAPTIVRDED